MDELKPCPFCGGRAEKDAEVIKKTNGRLWAFSVCCSRCCASSGLAIEPETAIEAWNRRVEGGK